MLLKAEWDKDTFISVDENHIETIIPMADAKNILFKRFEAKNKNYISALVQQFELRRQASALKKARTAKTGELDMDKLWATRLTEDVFLSNTVVPKGKNHGMVFIIDWSGPRHSATLEQVLHNPVRKKVGIPFDVYHLQIMVIEENMAKSMKSVRKLNEVHVVEQKTNL